MFGKLLRGIAIISIGLASLGLSQSVVGSQQIKDKDDPSPMIVQVGDYVLTVKDLERIIIAYPDGSVSSREAKVRLVESLITTKLFALAAREAKLDTAEDFPKAREKAHANVLIYSYVQRYVKPKFSEEEARKYFAAHKDQFQDFDYARSQIMDVLRDQALAATNQALMKEWGMTQKDDLLKDLDVRQAKDRSVVVAQIGSAAVTVGEVQELASLYPTQSFSTLAAKKELVNILVLEQLYRLAAEKAGLLNDPEVQKALARTDDQLLAMRYMDSVQRKITLEDARRYYQAHPEEFKSPIQLWLRQIVVSTPEAAQAVKARLDRGDSFEDIAKTSSIDRVSAAKGGDLGWVRKGRLHPEVEAVVFQMKPKQVSGPIKTPNGYSMMRLEERLEGAVRPFDDIASNLLFQLKSHAVESERQRLMAVYKVTINQQLL